MANVAQKVVKGLKKTPRCKGCGHVLTKTSPHDWDRCPECYDKLAEAEHRMDMAQKPRQFGYSDIYARKPKAKTTKKTAKPKTKATKKKVSKSKKK